jgi:hypothetical protein
LLRERKVGSVKVGIVDIERALEYEVITEDDPYFPESSFVTEISQDLYDRYQRVVSSYDLIQDELRRVVDRGQPRT